MDGVRNAERDMERLSRLSIKKSEGGQISQLRGDREAQSSKAWVLTAIRARQKSGCTGQIDNID